MKLKYDVTLSDEQQHIVDVFNTTTDNMLILGKAGVGKSVTLKAIQEAGDAKGLYGILCAPTGVAAMNIGGQTVHKCMSDLRTFLSMGYTGALTNLNYILIDEVSMVRADLLDDLNLTLQQCTGSFEPFGGKRIILIGDPGQLPPVIPDGAEGEYLKDNYLSPYFFSAYAYSKCAWNTIELTKVFRQQGDGADSYSKLLNMIRDGEKEKTVNALNKLFVTDEPKGIILCSTNKTAEMINNFMLENIQGDIMTFTAKVKGDLAENAYPAPYYLNVKVGSKVMVLKNIYGENGLELVNGDWGTVIRHEKAKLDAECDVLVIHCDRTQKEHLVYQDVWEQTKTVYDKESQELRKTIIASYIQFPLRLAWAVTIHKSQGASLHEYTIDCRSRMFAPGQLYVALSRGTNVEGLNILGEVKKSDVRICKKIQAFLKDHTKYVGIKKGGKYDVKSAKDIFKAMGQQTS